MVAWIREVCDELAGRHCSGVWEKNLEMMSLKLRLNTQVKVYLDGWD